MTESACSGRSLVTNSIPDFVVKNQYLRFLAASAFFLRLTLGFS
jgi:hypothetical protein